MSLADVWPARSATVALYCMHFYAAEIKGFSCQFFACAGGVEKEVQFANTIPTNILPTTHLPSKVKVEPLFLR